MTDDDPPMPTDTLRHWHTLITHAAEHDGPIATVPVESLMHLLQYAQTAALVLDEEDLADVVSGESDADVRSLGRHLRVVEDQT